MNMEIVSKPMSELRNNYWMIQKLGVGGFGKVYLIKQRENKELCAAKHQKWTSSDVPKLVRREVLALRKMINHVRHLLIIFMHLVLITHKITSPSPRSTLTKLTQGKN